MYYCLYFEVYVRYKKDFRDFKEVHTRLLHTRNVKKVRSFLWRISFYPCFSIITYFALLVAQLSISSFKIFVFFISFDGKGSDLNPPPPVWTEVVTQMVYLEGFLCAIAYGFTPSLRSQYPLFFFPPSSIKVLKIVIIILHI